MKKPTTTKAALSPTKRGAGYPALVKAISQVNAEMVSRVATVVNQALVLRNWMVGAYIVEFEQEGADRAKYGARLLPTLAADLAAKGIKGMSPRTLRDCATFYSIYPEIRQPALAAFMTGAADVEILQTVSAKSPGGVDQANFANTVRKIGERDAAPSKTGSEADFPSIALEIRQAPSAELPTPLKPEQLARISWAHFLELIRLDDQWQRAFYENELLRGHWSVRQLQRQIGSLLYERTGLSTDKKAVIERARKQEPRETIADMLRDPYILEFTGLADLPSYSEDELESALLDHLQKFLLELGQGFCFEARQFRMTEGRRHHRVDLVFYHRILRCHVLIDLKIRAFKPEDAGQMNFYVNWCKANLMQPGDNPPVGILLCSDRDGAEVEFATAGMDNKLFVSRYLKALPSAEQLKAFLERDRAEIKALTKGKR